MNHRKTALLGHSLNETGDSTIKVTYYANWFDGTGSRHPRIRYGKVHLLNNLYTNITGYGVGVTCAAQVLLEGNYFENTQFPVLISQVNDFNTLSGDPQGFLKAVSNFTVNSGEIVENLSGYNFDPNDYYTYEALDSQKVKSIVVSTAGAGKISIITSIDKKTQTVPQSALLEQNYPNPFNPETTIRYTVSAYGDTPRLVDLSIYNLLGQKVTTLVSGRQTAGSYKVEWDARDFPSGVYFYKLSTKEFTKMKKMILIK
jgi:flagellar hook assembly protein FlgD